MTREEFLKKIELLDKKQGNYKETTQVMAKRQERLKRSSQQFIDVFEHLVSKGYKVYAQELLSGNNAKKKPQRFSHLWLPEINTSIRFFGKADSDIAKHKIQTVLWKYLAEVREYCYTFVVFPDSNLDYIDEKIEYCKGFYEQNPRKGIKNDIVVPPKKKRERIKVAPNYEKVERKPII